MDDIFTISTRFYVWYFENHINVIIFSTTVLVCYVYDTVKMHMEKKKRPLIKKNDKCI